MSSTDQAIDQATSVAHDVVDKDKHVASDYAGRAQAAAGNLANTAKEYAGNAKDAAREYAGAARDKASDLAHRVGTHPLTDTTAKIPTEAFIVAAGASIAGSLVLKFLGRQKDADFVGHWAPTLISLGLLSKLVEHTRSTDRSSDRSPAGENL